KNIVRFGQIGQQKGNVNVDLPLALRVESHELFYILQGAVVARHFLIVKVPTLCHLMYCYPHF
ncbi:MAG: hypothetical protein ABSG67_17205, partial [Thermoguttaceae bacterium]